MYYTYRYITHVNVIRVILQKRVDFFGEFWIFWVDFATNVHLLGVKIDPRVDFCR